MRQENCIKQLNAAAFISFAKYRQKGLAATAEPFGAYNTLAFDLDLSPEYPVYVCFDSNSIKKALLSWQTKELFLMVRVARFELARFPRRILSPLCMPFHHTRAPDYYTG